jgi:hypothetical protein
MFRPSRCSMPATAELSTPPDMATAMMLSGFTADYAVTFHEGESLRNCAADSATASINAST